MSKKFLITTIALYSALSICTAVAQEVKEPPVVRVVRGERIGGGVEKPTGGTWIQQLSVMPTQAYEVKDGTYRSSISRITLRVPRIGKEKFVDVREAVAFTRPDGTAATTHIMFDPDGTVMDVGPKNPQSAVIVTRLRDDRPKDADSVLGGLDGGEQKRTLLSKQGFSYSRVDRDGDPTLQRIIPNRSNTRRFPYDIALLNESLPTTYGITTFILIGTDSLLELSQIFPCDKSNDADCRIAALKVHEEFVGGIKGFLTYPSQSSVSNSKVQ